MRKDRVHEGARFYEIEIALTLIERARADQVVPAPVQDNSAYGKSFAFRAHLRELKPPFNNWVGPGENVYRGLPCPSRERQKVGGRAIRVVWRDG